MLEQVPRPSGKLRPNLWGERGRRREMWSGKMRRASTTTKVNAAPEGRSATRSGYHRGRRDANQKNRSDANGTLDHHAQLRCPWCVSRGHTCRYVLADAYTIASTGRVHRPQRTRL